jgi:hypothetical protein
MICSLAEGLFKVFERTGNRNGQVLLQVANDGGYRFGDFLEILVPSCCLVV